MSISAINCTPIKPNVAFGNSTTTEDTQKYTEIVKATDSLNNQLVKSQDIKTPVQVALSVALAGLAAYAGGKAITSIVTKAFPNAGDKAFKYLKIGADKVKGEAAKLGEKAANGGKFAKVESYASKALAKSEDVARKAFKKIAYAGIAENVTGTARTAQALGNVIGAGAAAKVLADVCITDKNKDGVKDIAQKSQNIYTGTKTTYGNAMETAGVFAEILSVLG